MPEVAKRGFQTVLKETLDRIAPLVTHIGIIFDLDVLAVEDAPGVGTCVPHGRPLKEAIERLSILKDYPGFCGAEVVEFNPHLDKNKQTARSACDIIDCFVEV